VPETARLYEALEHHRAGRLDAAEGMYREILAREPGCADALHLLGMVLWQRGDANGAAALIREAIRIAPAVPEFRNNLGLVLDSVNLEANCRRAIAARPESAEAHANLAAALLNLDQLDEAESACREALRLKPALAEAYCNLGAVLLKKERAEEALACCEEAVRLKPDSPEALNNLGNAVRDRRRAREYYERALAADPAYFEAWMNLSTALKDLELREDAIAAGRRAVSLRPESAEARNNLGNVLREQGRIEEAQSCFREAIRCRPDLAEPYVNLAGTLKDQGRLEEALAACRKAIELDPKGTSTFSNFFFYQHYADLCPAETVFEEHRRWGERQRLFMENAPGHLNDRAPDRRLRVGYVSPDFRDHSVAYFAEPVVAAHNRESVEVYCYSNVARPDAVTRRFEKLADHWRDIRGLTDSQAAELVREDRIDILVDLAGHTAGSRLLVFARKPAPLQVTWCGYPATTGLAAIDYRITDALADLPGQTEHLYTERLVRLPGAFLCYGPLADAPPVSDLPARVNGYVTFGCFNFLAKVTPRIIEAWSALLAAAPEARLVLKSAPLVDESTRRLVRERFRAHGTDPGRVELLGPVTREEHLRTYHRIDIALDTFPYHGTTTTFEALWMGVPVVSAAGTTHASRVGVSLLGNAGLGDWVASSLEDYVELAAEKARRPDLLVELRAGLRGRLARSPLTDAALFVSRLEEAYRRMWRKEVSRSADLLCSRS
jgi:protein O-GlcNAc transferase